MIKIVICGFGFMGATHAACYRDVAGAGVVGIVDANPAAAAFRAEQSGLAVPVERALDVLLDRVEADAVDICLPTDIHLATVEPAFARGKHVFCEKPVALTVEDAESMVEGARRAGVQFMVGHCIRFWPEYLELEKLVRSGEAGKLLSLSMTRLSGRPGYTVDNWVSDPSRCTGAALDLHIHDTDFIRHLLGTPAALSSRGIELPTGWDFISTEYDYEGVTVHAEGGWHLPANWGFRMTYHAIFEEGSLEFDSLATPTLRRMSGAGEPELICMEGADSLTAYRAGLAHFVECLASHQSITINTGSEATESLRIVLAEIESARSRTPITCWQQQTV